MSEDRTEEFFALAQSIADSGEGPKPSLHSLPTTVHDNTSVGAHGSTVAGRYGGRYGGGGEAAAAAAARNDTLDDAASELRHFHAAASDISRDIAATSALLSELTHLVRRRTLFVDDTERVNWLVLRIKSNIEGLNGRLDEAGDVIAHQKRRLGRNSQAGQEASNLVGQLREEFARATTGFKNVLQQRSDNLKVAADRKRDVMGGGHPNSAPVGAAGGGDDSLVLQSKPAVYGEEKKVGATPSFLEANAGFGGGGGLQPLGGPRLDLTSAFKAQQQKAALGDSIPPGESSSSGSQLPRPYGAMGDDDGFPPGLRQRHSASFDQSFSEPLGSFSGYQPGGGIGGAPLTPLDIQRMEAESGQEQMMQLIPDQTYLRDRADAMTQVESNIAELGQIFNKLATMVGEHRELVQRVEDNVDDANETINLSLAQLTDTLENLRTNRALAMKVFSVMVVFIILFITFFA